MTDEQSAQETPATPEQAAAPVIEIVGDATPEQVAALMAVLSGLGGGADEGPAAPPSRWSDRRRLVRPEVHPGPGGWRASALPR